jgi:glycosyltransferase involved in cell wall biosynthesis
MKNKKDLVSIGLPIVKADYLEQAISCCLCQTYNNIEVIIVNNGKTLEIRKKIKDIVNKYNDKRIKYFENIEHLPMVHNWK